NFFCNSLITGMIWSPSFTASAPPGRKSYCTSIISKAFMIKGLGYGLLIKELWTGTPNNGRIFLYLSAVLCLAFLGPTGKYSNLLNNQSSNAFHLHKWMHAYTTVWMGIGGDQFFNYPGVFDLI